jgi:SPX domain protein involved in polyphosphate accumulation
VTQSEFLTLLDTEIEKTADFFNLRMKKGIRDCNSILHNKEHWPTSHDHILNATIEGLITVANDLIEISTFAELNIIGVRKILKKFDKKFNSLSM